MSDEPLSDAHRGKLYHTLLVGMADECQRRNCAADTRHAWGEVWWEAVYSDDPVTWDFTTPVSDKVTFQRVGTRKCLSCGKVETVKPI